MNLIETSLIAKIERLEKEPQITTNQNNEYSENDSLPFYYVKDYLYHGLRFQGYLEKLESIFKLQKILAGKYIPEYYIPYFDNCNKGEYVSLLKLSDNKVEYDEFILSNISLLISPLCDAIETKYIDYNTWCDLQKSGIGSLKHCYSYLRGECFCKDFIPFEMIKAIGVPYQRLKFEGKLEYANRLLKDIILLMEKYDISLPIVDTSIYNYILVDIKGMRRV